MGKSKDKLLKNKKKKIHPKVTLYERNGKVYDIYSGKIFKAEDCFDEETKELKRLVREKYG